MTGESHRYLVYGLVIQSTIELPLFKAPDPDVEVAVDIHRGAVPATLPGATRSGLRFEAREGELLLRVEDVGRYLVSEGRVVTVDVSLRADEDEMLGYLTGSALAALLHQRGLVPLHAGAIATSHGAMLFMGRSGVGKSTLVAGLVKRGYRMLADDVSVISVSSAGSVIVHPGIPRVRLHEDSLAALDLVTDRLSPPRLSDGKRVLDPGASFVPTASELGAIFSPVRVPGNAIELRRQSRARSFSQLTAHTYRRQFLIGREACRKHFDTVSTLADQVRTYRALRPRNTMNVEGLINALEAEFPPPAA